jgi:hypothetical protein
MMAATSYDVYDPDTIKVSPDIVIDEIFNAYNQQ